VRRNVHSNANKKIASQRQRFCKTPSKGMNERDEGILNSLSRKKAAFA